MAKGVLYDRGDIGINEPAARCDNGDIIVIVCFIPFPLLLVYEGARGIRDSFI
jgi:hypothetical protein